MIPGGSRSILMLVMALEWILPNPGEAADLPGSVEIAIVEPIVGISIAF
jgi:hypothetical protein